MAVERLRDAPSTVWLIQCNPKVTDAVDLRRGGELPTNWTVNIRVDEIQAGDLVVFWLSGKKAGVYALGEITGPAYPGMLNEDDILTDDHPNWDTFVPFDLYLDLFDCPILRADLKADPRFAGESIIVQPWAANAHRVSKPAFQAILERAANQCHQHRTDVG